jgi:hypothetical protein
MVVPFFCAIIHVVRTVYVDVFHPGTGVGWDGRLRTKGTGLSMSGSFVVVCHR